MTNKQEFLKAPYHYFGGKHNITDMVWYRLGNVDRYIEPFFGSGVMLLKRPNYKKMHREIVSDKDHFITNFWRAVKAAPDKVAEYANNPVNQCFIHAIHNSLVPLFSDVSDFAKNLYDNPDYYDAKVAGRWVYGLSSSIGAGWCTLNKNGKVGESIPLIMHTQGINSGTYEKHLKFKKEWLNVLSERLENVFVCCGDWTRVLGAPIGARDSGLTGVFLDPPYCGDIEKLKSLIDGNNAVSSKVNRAKSLYRNDENVQDIDQLVADVNKWCQEWGKDKNNRIALAGYDGEHNNLVDNHEWSVSIGVAGSAMGYSSISKTGNGNHLRERVWFSPYCLPEKGVLKPKPLF